MMIKIGVKGANRSLKSYLNLQPDIIKFFWIVFGIIDFVKIILTYIC